MLLAAMPAASAVSHRGAITAPIRRRLPVNLTGGTTA